MNYKKVVNIETGVINTVDEEQFDYLMKSGDYQDFKEEEKEEKKKPGRPKKED